MEEEPGEGLFFALDELAAVFSRFKKSEGDLSGPERRILRRIEKAFYERLSIKEIEELENPGGGGG
jgi:hypothetical protein